MSSRAAPRPKLSSSSAPDEARKQCSLRHNCRDLRLSGCSVSERAKAAPKGTTPMKMSLPSRVHLGALSMLCAPFALNPFYNQRCIQHHAPRAAQHHSHQWHVVHHEDMRAASAHYSTLPVPQGYLGREVEDRSSTSVVSHPFPCQHQDMRHFSFRHSPLPSNPAWCPVFHRRSPPGPA